MMGFATQGKYLEDHAALLGHVTIAWNDCHYMVLSIFHTLSGVSWETAYAIFLALKSDHDRREITLALMKEVLDTNNDQPMREWGTRLLGQLSALAGERNLATHTMWATVINMKREGQPEVRPNPSLPQPKNLKVDFGSQFSNLTTSLRNLFRELLDYDPALRVHLKSSRARPQENVAALESGNGP
jgi:hypothetical protein